MPTLYQLSSPFTLLLLLQQWQLFASLFTHAETFLYGEFNESRILLQKDASLHSERVITLTNQTLRSMGRALYPTPIRIKPNNNSVFSFSTTFVFSIVVPPHDLGGHGIAFIMAPNKSLMAAQESQYLGLFNTATNGLQSNHLFAVEFDTNFNPEFGDIDDNHVGVDLNSLVSLHPQTAGYWIDKDHLQNFSLKSGKNIQAWIDYDHVQDQLNVSVSVAGREKPIRPLVSVSNFNLSQVLEDEIYAGFTAATGFYAVAEHYILGWSFSTDGKAPPLDLSGLPSLIRKKSITESKGFTAAVTVAAVVLLVVGLFFLLLRLKEIKDRELIDEWELEYWPHRIPYKDLKAATQGFGNEQLLGRGGFGRVYRGVLATNGLEVAVKCITKDSSEGMKEFIAEISSVGRLQHRNLVQLRGWCRKHKQLFIVYDYMPNGSLDKMIFPSREAKKVVLSWAQRYEILKGVAAGLLYLHEQWDRRVVHRDVKSSNILLDSELNAKLGDFGLARLYDHTENPETTRVVGTVGYIAPEVTNTGKVTPSSDVFSFGIVLLEVACGRRPVDLSMEFALLDWVRDLYEKGKLVHAADPNLDGVYNAEEMERVLKLGLFCSHPQPEKRLTIRTALQILDGQAPLPVHQIPWTSFDVSPKDYRQGAVQVTEEGESEGLLSFGFKSQDMATSSPGLSYDRDSDYEVGR